MNKKIVFTLMSIIVIICVYGLFNFLNKSKPDCDTRDIGSMFHKHLENQSAYTEILKLINNNNKELSVQRLENNFKFMTGSLLFDKKYPDLNNEISKCKYTDTEMIYYFTKKEVLHPKVNSLKEYLFLKKNLEKDSIFKSLVDENTAVIEKSVKKNVIGFMYNKKRKIFTKKQSIIFRSFINDSIAKITGPYSEDYPKYYENLYKITQRLEVLKQENNQEIKKDLHINIFFGAFIPIILFLIARFYPKKAKNDK